MLTINVFSNVCETDSKLDPVFRTLDSLQNCFGEIRSKVNVYVHPSPFQRFHAYKDAIEDYFPSWFRPNVIRTKGLADGYRRSILGAEMPYLFQLEHDWLFKRDRIRHSLDDILHAMEASNAEYLRFGKEPSRTNEYGHQFEQADIGIPACAVTWRSNNPHIINAEAYKRRYLPYINTTLGGSKGIEEFLPEAPNSYVYGDLDYPATIEHINGRSRLRGLEKRIGKPAFKALRKIGLLEPAFRVWA